MLVVLHVRYEDFLASGFDRGCVLGFQEVAQDAYDVLVPFLIVCVSFH